MARKQHTRRKTLAELADKHRLYEASVQDTDDTINLLTRLYKRWYGHRPRSLKEDFCGTAALTCHWVRHHRDNTAVGLDLHGPTLEYARKHHVSELTEEQARRLTLLQQNVQIPIRQKVDVVNAFNFSWWVFLERKECLKYFAATRQCLKRQGAFVLDIYGGPDAQRPQLEPRDEDGFEYIWDQDYFNPITHEYHCYIHFKMKDGSRLDKAFSYKWRLYGIAETVDMLHEAGFPEVEVLWDHGDEDGDPRGIFRPSVNGDHSPAWIAYLAAYNAPQQRKAKREG